MAGKTVAVKDNISTEGVRTTCGSAMLKIRAAVRRDGRRAAETAGATIPGKTNMDEFPMGTTTETSAFGAVENPAAEGRVPGGSSGGSAAVVAAGDADLALGTDTGGSVRNPAAFCGVVGIKPTYGLVSRYGLIAYANSLEQVGPIGRPSRSAAELLDVIAGRDEHDATTQEAPEADGSYAAAADGDVDGLSIGVPTELLDGADEAVVETFGTPWRPRIPGCEIVEVDLPSVEHAVKRTTSSPCPRRPRTSRASTASVTVSRPATTATGTTCYADTRERVRRGGQTADPPWHVRPLSGLPRQVLQESTGRSRVDQTGLRRGVRRGGRSRHADDARPRRRNSARASTTRSTMYLADANTTPMNLQTFRLPLPAGETDDGLPVGIQLVGPRSASDRSSGPAAHWHKHASKQSPTDD